jgi:hypothetical protein
MSDFFQNMSKNVKAPKTTERQEQTAFVSYVLQAYAHRPDFIRGLFFSTLNGAWLGGKRPAYLMEKMKGEGALPGVSDLLYLQPRGGYAYLAIEMKTTQRERERLGGLTEEQRDFLHNVNFNGGRARVCYGADEAIETFNWYMGMALPDKIQLNDGGQDD